MIFPTESVSKLRGELEERVASGEITDAEAYREALAADPDDPRALRFLALLAEEEEDLELAEELAWRWLRADPLSPEAFRLIGLLLSLKPEDGPRGVAYAVLASEKEGETSAPIVAPGGEPEAVTYELEPHRLMHEMWIAGTGELNRAVIDGILARGPDCVPYLAGVLNLAGEDLLDEVDDAMLARSLALLGEIGAMEAVPALARFLPLEDETIGGAARWAFQRLAFRNPRACWRRFAR